MSRLRDGVREIVVLHRSTVWPRTVDVPYVLDLFNLVLKLAITDHDIQKNAEVTT